MVRPQKNNKSLFVSDRFYSTNCKSVLFIVMFSCSMFFCYFVFLRNKAIADYLASNGYTGTLSEFQKEADMVCSDKQRYSCPFLDNVLIVNCWLFGVWICCKFH